MEVSSETSDTMYKGPHLADYCTRCSTSAAMAVRLTSTLLIIFAGT